MNSRSLPALVLRASVVCLLAAPAVLLGAANSADAAAWLPPVPLSAPEPSSSDPRIAVDAAGDAVAVWERFDGTHEVIEAASRPAGGSWSAPTKLTDGMQDDEVPQVAIDANGDAVAAWESFPGTKALIKGAVHPAGGTWSAPVTVSDEAVSAGRAEIAIDRGGEAVAIWEANNAGHEVVEAASITVGGAWSTPAKLSDPTQTSNLPQIAIDSAGEALATWARGSIVESASRPAGGPWSTPVKVSEGLAPAELDLAVDPTGRAVAVWRDFVGTRQVVDSASRTASGAWSRPVELTKETQSAGSPRAAIDASGEALAIWVGSHGGSGSVIEVASDPAGNWSTPTKLSDESQLSAEPQIAVDPDGDAVAVWQRSDGTNLVLDAASRPTGGGWSAPTGLSDETHSAIRPQIAVDDAGDAQADWVTTATPPIILAVPGVIESATYDASPPALLGASIPSTGTVGVPVSFSATATDLWSSAAASWSFGDQGVATGFTPTHSYAAAGSYQVRLEVRDAAGNATAKVQTIVISPAAGAAPGDHRARAGRLVKVRNGRALVSLSCPQASAATACAGAAKLTARRGKRITLLAGGTFHLAAGTQSTVRLALRPKARRLLAAAGTRRLRARLAGAGLVARTVSLVPSRAKRH